RPARNRPLILLRHRVGDQPGGVGAAGGGGGGQHDELAGPRGGRRRRPGRGPGRGWVRCPDGRRVQRAASPGARSRRRGPAEAGGGRADFVHLHVRSEYSLLDGAAHLKRLVERAAQLGFPALALTDHGNLFGAMEFYQLGRAAGVKPIVGAELYVAPGSRTERAPLDGQYEGANHVTVLVRNLAGYRNLIKLVSKGYLEGFYYKPRVDKRLLAEHADGLLVLSGCLNSEVSRLLMAGDEKKAREIAGWYAEVFGREHYFMEVQAHGLPDQIRVTEGTLRIAQALGGGRAGTTASPYLDAADARAHEVLLCLQTGAKLSDPSRWRFSTEEFYLKSAEEMRKVFAELPEAYANTVAVAEQC